MSEHGIVVEELGKKFRRGELHDSLRDLLPGIAKRIFTRAEELQRLEEGEFWALRNVSFTVRPGEALGIIGQNGAGKSTLLKILSGILRPNEGSISVRGRLRALIEVAAGFHPDLTGRENIFLNGAILGMRRREIGSKLDQIVDFSGIEAFLDTPVKRYSSGMVARLGFSVAAHMEPQVLLVDEILAVGDLAFQRKCHEHMRGLAAQGVAIILVSHNLAAITQLCPKTLVLAGGRTHFLGTTDQAQQSYLSLLFSRDRTNGDYILEELQLTNASGASSAVFNSGDTCHIKAIVRTAPSFPNLSLGLSVLTATGQEIFHTSIARLGGDTLDVGENGHIELRGSLTLNLTGGRYTIQIVGLDYASITRVKFRIDGTIFEIIGTPEHGGLCYLAPSLQQRVTNDVSVARVATP